jgi:hypothetical protein
MSKRRTTKYTGAYFTVEQAAKHFHRMQRRERIKTLAKGILSLLSLMVIALALGSLLGSLVMR